MPRSNQNRKIARNSAWTSGFSQFRSGCVVSNRCRYQYPVVKLLYSDRAIRPVELEFLRELKRDARVTSPEFNELCNAAFQASATNWDVGGTPSSTDTTVLSR